MRRRIMKDLYEWKDRYNRKPLLVTGVRQCGKTYSICRFGEEAFEDVAYFNFEENETIASIFNDNYNTGRILDELGSLILHKTIVPGKTLVIFDEIQSCPRAITSLKYFCENLPELHIIAAGSLLGLALRSFGNSFPVGKVNRLEMFPMDFYEFVSANGGDDLLEVISKYDISEPFSDIVTVPMIKYLKLYYIVGGMPEVVDLWVKTHDFDIVSKKQDELLKDYENDFGKYAPSSLLPRIRLVWSSVPAQLSKENSKFIFSHVRKGLRARDLEDALEWLVDAGLVYKLCLVENPEIPLDAYSDSTYFKVFMSDVGLLCRKSGIDYRVIMDDHEMFIRSKGALTENYIMTQLRSMCIDSYFWRSKADAEVDFLISYNSNIVPVEVKSSDNTKAKSLKLFCEKYKNGIAIKTSLKNVGKSSFNKTEIWSIPLYAFFRIREYIEHESEKSFPEKPIKNTEKTST